MKRFLLNIPERLKYQSQALDAQTILCDKAWTVFNDEGAKQLFIFKPNGSLLITINGIVYKSTWEYLPVNNSVVITSEGKSVMFHPAFIDEVVLVLEQDGGTDRRYLIDEASQNAFSPKSLNDLQLYFQRKELAIIEAEIRQKEHEAKRLEQLERQRVEELLRTKNEQTDRQRTDHIAIRKKKEDQIREEASALRDSFRPKAEWLSYVVLAISLGVCISYSLNSDEFAVGFLITMICPFGLFFLSRYLLKKECDNKQKERIEEWQEEHPNDPRNNYL